eukprot:PhM_4_TR13065/c0_g1_i1/m.44167
MATTCSKHHQRSEADSISRIGKTGTLKDDLNFQRQAAIPVRGSKLTNENNSIVLGSSEPTDGRFKTIKTTSFQGVNTGDCLGKNNSRYMNDKHFMFSNDPPTMQEAMTSENRGMMKAPPPEMYKKSGEKEQHPATLTSIFLGKEDEKPNSMSRLVYRNHAEAVAQSDPRAGFAQRAALHRGTHFALGSDAGQWQTIQRDSYNTKQLPELVERGKNRGGTLQLGGVGQTGFGAVTSTSKAVYQGHDTTRQHFTKRIVPSNVIMGYENRECKSTQRGDFKPTEFVSASSPSMLTASAARHAHHQSPTRKEFVVPSVGVSVKPSPLNI